ncbi:MAG: prepilin-type N-terminal cleavage/methylation domain-containing protein [Verrucomicrobiae bacterium]|nr:prepilin-type N-terminal cleavage/methylation domain-containing protein [Verrucomicrobiae bacterium]
MKRPSQPLDPGYARRNSRSAAFTLIEVLVATFVFTIVLASLFGTWRVIARSTDTALHLATESQRTRLALQCIEEAFSAIEMFQSNLRWYSFLADTSGPYAEVSFAANLGDSFPGSGYYEGQRLRRITLRVEAAPEGGNHLVMHQTPLLSPLEGAVDTHPLVLATEVSQFSLLFWDRRQNKLVEEWPTTNQLPMLVDVTLGLGTRNRMSRQPATIVNRMVRLPDGPIQAALQGAPAAAGGTQPRR